MMTLAFIFDLISMIIDFLNFILIINMQKITPLVREVIFIIFKSKICNF